MRELHVVALSGDGRHVVLATRPGAASGEFRVAVDDRLTAAVRGELPAPGRDAPPSISPRDIQARLRDGEAPEDIAASAGVPLSRVERYAGPVLAELDRMISGARTAVVSRPRLGASARPLGEAVETHLAEVAHLAEGSVRWSARRSDLGRWVVQVSWTARGRRRTAGWHYDPATREVVAVDGPSAVLGHVEADAVPAPAATRSARPAARGARSTTTGAARPAAAVRATTGAAASTSSASGSSTTTAPDPRAATRPATARAGATARTSAPRATTTAPTPQPTTSQAAARQASARATAPAAPTRRRTTTPPAPAEQQATRRTSTARASAAPSPTAAAPAARRRPALPTAPEPGAAAAGTGHSRRAPSSPEQRPARRTPATAQPAPRRAASRRSAVPSFDDLAAPAGAPTGDAPAADAPTLGAAAAGPPTAPPPGPPVLRVVPPAAPEPAPEVVDDAPGPETRPVRRAAGGRDWADVLMGSAPPAEPRRD